MGSSHIIFDKWAGTYADCVTTMRTSAVRDLFAAASRSDIISLSGGMPDISKLPLEAIAEMAKKTILEEGVGALQYGGTDGRLHTKEVLIDLMAELGVDCKPEDMIITSGAQQALDLLAKVFVNPGDVIITEGPTYLGALQAFSAYEPKFVCIPLDDDGMRIDLLEEKLKELGKGKAKFLYTIPNFQNPGGVTMSLERRKRLLELSKEYAFPIIEDDPYGRLRYSGEDVPSLRSLDDEVIYLGTVSKIFAPGLRTGWVIAPRPILAKVNLVKQGADLCGSAFNQVMVEHYFKDTPWRETLAKLVANYAERRDAMLQALEEYFPPEATWTHLNTNNDYVDVGSVGGLVGKFSGTEISNSYSTGSVTAGMGHVFAQPDFWSYTHMSGFGGLVGQVSRDNHG
ncbi:MAG: aminotransferase class I/II-fold pyridoxal phosphate-dependent enzyme, partial [Actinobacteria bacterium]|nr:aminotransferase class I/II-fold pyridoxal phosphate-dependent enzyme [Actinomycetota bacterium]